MGEQFAMGLFGVSDSPG